MFIVFGTRGIKSEVSDSAPLTGSCPQCQGSLHHKQYRRWFTLFFIPVIPLDVLDTFYECGSCNSAYAENVRDLLQTNKEQQAKANEDAKKIFAKAIVASATHMAMIDGHFAESEEREINDMIDKFPDYRNELLLTMDHVRANGNKDNYVFNILNETRNALSAEAVVRVLAQSAVVLLADGKIEKEEEALMKEYLVAVGMPKEFYETLIQKLSNVNPKLS